MLWVWVFFGDFQLRYWEILGGFACDLGFWDVLVAFGFWVTGLAFRLPGCGGGAFALGCLTGYLLCLLGLRVGFSIL